MNRMPTDTVNIFSFLCDISEASDEVFRESEREFGCHDNLQLLARLGVMEPGPRLETVVCNACDADHPVVIEYDAERRCYFHCCPEAGMVTVKNADLITYRFRPERLTDWLTKSPPIISPPGRPSLVQDSVWHLGDATCGDTRATIIFARRVSSQAALDLLASALRPVHPIDKGLVVTTSPHVAREIRLPNGFEFLDLCDIGQWVAGQLIVDRTSLCSRVQRVQGKPVPAKRQVGAVPKGRREPSRLDWREANKPLITEMHTMILKKEARNPTDAARALARRASGNGTEASKVTRLAAAYMRMHPRV
jgi:hypothetical protein